MRVARLHGRGDLRVGEEREPEPAPGEVLVRVTAVGICGSDLHWYDESGIGEAHLDRPLVLGHEAAGVIVSGPRAMIASRSSAARVPTANPANRLMRAPGAAIASACTTSAGAGTMTPT